VVVVVVVVEVTVEEEGEEKGPMYVRYCKAAVGIPQAGRFP